MCQNYNWIRWHFQVNYSTVTGQCLDMITSVPEKAGDFSEFSMERYNAIVKWKTAFYSFYLPVALALHMVWFVAFKLKRHLFLFSKYVSLIENLNLDKRWIINLYGRKIIVIININEKNFITTLAEIPPLPGILQYLKS